MNEMNSGYFHYYCMTKAIEVGFRGHRGILLMSDDVLLKHWRLGALDPDKIWFPERLFIGRDYHRMRIGLQWWDEFERGTSEVFRFIGEVNGQGAVSVDPDMKNYPGEQSSLWDLCLMRPGQKILFLYSASILK